MIHNFLQMTGFNCRICFFRQILLNVEHKPVTSFMFRAKTYTNMPWSTSNRIVQNVVVDFSLPLEKTLHLFGTSAGLLLVVTRFAPRNSQRLAKNQQGHVAFFHQLWRSHYDINHPLFDSILRAVFVRERYVFYSNQRVYSIQRALRVTTPIY